MSRVLRLDRLRDPKRRIHRAGKRHRHQHDRRRVALDRRRRQAAQQAIDQVRRRRQRLRQCVEAGLALRQALGVAHELEARIDRIAQHIGNVVEVQRGQVARAVLHAQRTEGPGHRVVAVVVDIGLERGKARPLGQEAARADAVRECGVAALQEGHRRADRRAVLVEVLDESARQRTALVRRQRGNVPVDRRQSIDRQQRQREPQRQIFLHRVHAA